MSKVFSQHSSGPGGGMATTNVVLEDGRTGYGSKVSFSIRGASQEDQHIADTRAIQNANSKPVPKSR